MYASDDLYTLRQAAACLSVSAIDIRRINEFGVGTYTRNVVRALSRLDRENEYVLIGSPDKVEEIGPLPPNFQSVSLVDRDTTLKGFRDCRAVLKRFRCDLVHSPHLFWAHLFWSNTSRVRTTSSPIWDTSCSGVSKRHMPRR